MQKGLLLAKNRTLGKKEGKSMRKSVLLHFFYVRHFSSGESLLNVDYLNFLRISNEKRRRRIKKLSLIIERGSK